MHRDEFSDDPALRITQYAQISSRTVRSRVIFVYVTSLPTATKCLLFRFGNFYIRFSLFSAL